MDQFVALYSMEHYSIVGFAICQDEDAIFFTLVSSGYRRTVKYGDYIRAWTVDCIFVLLRAKGGHLPKV